MKSAASADMMAEQTARSSLKNLINTWEEIYPVSEDIPVTIYNTKPDLKGPVFYTNLGMCGFALNTYDNGATEYKDCDFHNVVVAFSDFSITPIIPDEDDSEPYVYVKADGGSSSSNEQKVVSDVKNYSGQTITATQNISESISSTVTSSISGSASTGTTDSYGLSDTIKVGGKFSFDKAFEASAEESVTVSSNHSTTETVSKGWSSSEGTTSSESESRSVSLSLPPYTTALMSQQHLDSKMKIKYNCPVALNFKVTVYYVFGNYEIETEGLTILGEKIGVSFDKLTEFGASTDARSDLASRYAQGTGTAQMTDKDGIEWPDIKESIDSEIQTLTGTVPFDSTGAEFSAKINLVKTEVDDILPIYPIDAIRFVNPNNVLTSQRWLSEINMEVGDIDYTNNYSLRALNEYGGDFYKFYKPNGSFVFLDEDGKDITASGNAVVKPEKDPVSGQIKFKAVGEGTVYLRYKIKDDVYKTASMAASNTPDDFVTDEEITNPAILQVNVKDTGHHHKWLKPKYTWAEDYSTCTAACVCKYDDTHIMRETSDTELISEKQADCTNAGEKVYRATFETEGFETQEVTVKEDPLGHKWGDWENTDEDTHTRICENDPTHIETAPHNWDSGVVTRPATTTSAGEITYTCTDCGAVKKEAIGKVATANVYARMAAKGKKSETITWKKVSAADGYMIYFASCDTGDTYGTCKLIKTITNNNTFKLTKKGLKKGKCYKAYVAAYKNVDGNKVVIGKSLLMHSVAGNYSSKYTNPKKVVLKKSRINVKTGRKVKIKGQKIIKYRKNIKNLSHEPLFRYISSDTGIATVSAKGTITGKRKGTCKVDVIAVNGVSKTITVNVR